MQWLVAGSGAMHEEILSGDRDGVLHAAQVWINLPAASKMKPAEHHAVNTDRVPEIASLGNGSAIRLYSGAVAGAVGPAPLGTPVLLAHISLQPHGHITVPVPAGWNAAATALAGRPAVAGEGLVPGHTVVFRDDGVTVSFDAPNGGELLLMAGEPIGEPIVMGGGHVMNTREEIAQAFLDDRAGRMGRLSPTRHEEIDQANSDYDAGLFDDVTLASVAARS
jgi:redox-sensitive bicupin YhaK (pirin superfamily)